MTEVAYGGVGLVLVFAAVGLAVFGPVRRALLSSRLVRLVGAVVVALLAITYFGSFPDG